MILVCPACHTRYLISANLFTAGPRQVRCARCGHSWQAELPKEIDAVGTSPDADLTPAPETIPPIPPGSNLPALRKNPLSPGLWRALIGGAVAVLVLLVAGLLLNRHEIAEKWPVTEAVYDTLGLPIAHYGEGLSFVGVRSELRYESGKMLLVVEGKIHNGSSKVEEIPAITATALGVDGKTVQSWQIDAPTARVLPEEDVEFHSSIDAPKDAVAEINLNFVETKQ